MSNPLLSTMAILLADYDEQKDYLSNFEPFVLDRLKAWERGQEVRPKLLAENLSQAFSLPGLPINTVSILRDRVKKRGFLEEGRNGKDYVCHKKLAEVSEIAPGRTEALAHFNALTDAVKLHASSVFDLAWKESDADAALNSFAERFGVEMALARRDGQLSDVPNSADESLTVVHSFARRALERDPEQAQYLEELVKSSMLTNVIYFQDLGNWTPQVEKLVVYLDTPFVLRLLGLEPDEVAIAALELMKLLAEFEIPVRVFEHTVEETIGVLEAVRNSLTRARRREFDSQTVSAVHRESVEHLLSRGWGAGDVQEIISDIDRRLGDLGVVVEPTPSYTRELSLDEGRFENLLREHGYFHEHQIVKDVRSLSAVHRLRHGRVCRDLSETPAIFLTSNNRLVRASARFFGETGNGAPIAHCVSDISLTTQIWLRRPGQHPGIAQKVLMAESYAALQPPAELWSRYLEKIATQMEKGAIDDRQVKVLVLSSAGREGLLEMTAGDARRVNDETPLHVLERYEEVVSRSAREEAADAAQVKGEVAAENERLVADLERLTREASERDERLATQDRQIGFQDRKINELEKWRQDEAARAGRRDRRRELARRVLGVGLAFLLVFSAVGIAVADTITGPAPLAGLWIALGVGALGCAAWGLKLANGWTWKAVVAIGVIAGIFGGLYGVLSDGSATDRSPAVDDENK